MNNSKEAYQNYLKSDHWKALRERVYERDGHKCTRCGCPHNIQAHHVKYASKWEDTPIEWIKTLCDTCHDAAHRKIGPMNIEKLIDSLDWRIKAHTGNDGSFSMGAMICLMDVKGAILESCSVPKESSFGAMTMGDLEDLVFGLQRMRTIEWVDENDTERERRLKNLYKRFQDILKEHASSEPEH